MATKQFTRVVYKFTSGIYLIKCSKCDAIYIGQTKRSVKTRLKKHERDCKLTTADEKKKEKP